MAIHEFRETLEQANATVSSTLGESDKTALIITKRIELEEGKRHTLMAVDFMDDSFILPAGSNNAAYEVFLSPYPINLTRMQLAETFDWRGPLASDDAVLFKETVVWYGENTSDRGPFRSRLPNNFLGSNPTYSWYTPTLYFTVVLHQDFTTLPTSIDFEDLGMSFYAAVESKEVDTVEYLMGAYGEYQDAQTRLRMSQGYQVSRPINTYQGQTFPTWKFGGIRPERMIRGLNSFANFFLAKDDAERTLPIDQARIFVNRARTMQPYDTAFGEVDPAKGDIPDWIRFHLSPSIAYGPICTNMPPKRKDDNGNTLMFLASDLV